jgi:hypothetical protein
MWLIPALQAVADDPNSREFPFWVWIVTWCAWAALGAGFAFDLSGGRWAALLGGVAAVQLAAVMLAGGSPVAPGRPSGGIGTDTPGQMGIEAALGGLVTLYGDFRVLAGMVLGTFAGWRAAYTYRRDEQQGPY